MGPDDGAPVWIHPGEAIVNRTMLEKYGESVLRKLNGDPDATIHVAEDLLASEELGQGTDDDPRRSP